MSGQFIKPPGAKSIASDGAPVDMLGRMAAVTSSQILAWAARRRRQIAAGAVLALVLIAAFVFRGDIVRASLDPKTPFQTYRPPPAPDYARPSAWALAPASPAAFTQGGPGADVFFVHPTTYNGGEEWNGPIDHKRSVRQLFQVMLPNYAGPFARAGRVFAPRYRQASLYAMLSLREDAREARAFAYADVARAFRLYLDRFNHGRPIILAGVEQGGQIVERLAREAVAADPALKARIAAVYAIDAIVPAEAHTWSSPIPPCQGRAQARCIVAYLPEPKSHRDAGERALRRALVFGKSGELEPLAGRPALCVNPLTGSVDAPLAARAANLGAANATKLEWGVRPAFLPRQVSARCEGGVLWVSHPRSGVLSPAGGWADRRKAPGYNLFYLDLETDAKARIAALNADPTFHEQAPPITQSIDVKRVPLMGRR